MAAVWACRLEAASIVREGFDYPIGSELHGQNGGEGWMAPWFINPSTSQVLMTNVEGLSYPGWPTQGAAAAWCTRNYQSTRQHPVLPALDGDVVWFSLLFHATNTSQTRVQFASASSTTGFGIEIASTNGGVVRAKINATQSTMEAPAALSNTHLVIGKFVFSNATPDHLDVWVNPTNWISEEALGPAHSVVEANVTTNTAPSVYLRTDFFSNLYEFACDELRLGTKLVDVINIANPSPVEQPVNIAPAAGADQVPLVATLQGSAFVSSAGGDAHAASEFRLDSSLGTTIIQTGPLTEVQVTLQSSRRYSWQVSYKGTASPYWSTPSDPTVFTTAWSGVGTLIAYDGAAYAPITNLTGRAGGTGWATAWNESGSGTNKTRMSVQEGGLEYVDPFDYALDTLSNRFASEDTLAGGNTSINVRVVRAVARDGFYHLVTTNGNFGKEGTVNWLSFLVRFESGDPDATYGAGFMQQWFEPILVAGRMTGNDNWGVWRQWGASAFSTEPAATGVTAFLVVKVLHNGTTADAYLWVNPVLTAAPSESVAVPLTGINDFQFAYLGAFVVNADTNLPCARVAFDELRFGEDWEHVMPNTLIPEPAGIGLIASVVALARLRHRQRAAV